MNDHPLASSLTDVSVVQVGHRPSNFVLRILGDLGAQVSQVVVSDGSSSEATGTPTHEAHYTAGVNVIRVSEVEEVLAEISRHDVVINSCQGETSVPLLDARQIEQINSSNSRAILCHVTHTGLSALGPNVPRRTLRCLLLEDSWGHQDMTTGRRRVYPLPPLGVRLTM